MLLRLGVIVSQIRFNCIAKLQTYQEITDFTNHMITDLQHKKNGFLLWY